MQLDKILSISGRPGLFEMEAQTRGGIVARSLVDGKRVTTSVNNQVSVLSEIQIYCIGTEVPLAEVFDPTGAGDTFAGGFIGFLAKTDDISFENMKRAVIWGSAMASFTVEKFGTERIAELSTEEINARLAEFKYLMSVDIQLV